MKRVLFILMALACVSALSFGQGVFHTWNLGEYIVAGQLQEGPVGAGWGPAWDAAGGLDQEWTFAYDGKNFGFDATLEFGSADFANVSAGGGVLPGGFEPITWFGTYYKFGNYAKLYVGMPRDNDYSFLSYINGLPVEQRLMDSQWGANLQVFPLSGLAVMLTGYQPPGGDWATPAVTGFLTGELNFVDNFAVGAKYTWPDKFTALAYYKAIQLNNSVPTSVYQTYGAHNNANILNKKYIDVGLQYVGIKDVGIQGEAAYDFSDQGGTALDQQFSLYLGGTTTKVPNTTLGLDFFLTSIANQYTVFTVEASGQYLFPKAGGWGVGAEIGYDLGAGAARWNGWGNGQTPLTGYNGAGFLLEPFVVYVVEGGWVKIAFVYVTGGPDYSTAGHPSTKPSWGIPISYNWSF